MSLMAKPTTRFMRTMLITSRKAAKRTLAIQGVPGSSTIRSRVRLSGSAEVEQHSKWLLKVGLSSQVGLLKNTSKWVKADWVRVR